MVLETVFLEPTTSCNLRCKYCCNQDGSAERRPPQFMSVGLFEKVLSQLLGVETRRVNFWGFGEPFMHPHYVDMCRQLSSKGIEVVSNTNGHFIQNPALVIESGISKLIFSIDGTTARTYVRYRRGGDFDWVMANLRSVVLERDRLESPMDIVWQFIVFPWNEHEVDEVRAMAQDMNISCTIKTNLGLGDTPSNQRYIRKADERGFVQMTLDEYENMGSKCRCPIILVDGRIAMCLYDSQGEFMLGDLTKEYLSDAMQSESWRLLWHQQQSDELELCRKKCSYWYKRSRRINGKDEDR